jgi:two-component system invasion response regulator UvrY
MIKMFAKRYGFTNLKYTTCSGEALFHVINELKPALVFCEAGFYDSATPFMMRELKQRIKRLRVALFSLGQVPIEKEMQFVAYGVESYISLYYGMADFIHGFRAILGGENYLAHVVRLKVAAQRRLHEPSTRETEKEDEILVMLANGKTVKEVADFFGVSERTVAHQKTSIFSRFQVRNMAELIRAAQNAGTIVLRGEYVLSRNREQVTSNRGDDGC